MANICYDMLPYQEEFQASVKPKCYLSAGYGAGKTYALIMKAFALMDINSGMPGGIVCPTLKMFKRDVLPEIAAICGENDIRFKYHRADGYLFFPNTKSVIWVFHGEDDGQSIRGPNLAFMLINELSLLSEGTFKAALARVRLKKAKLLQVAASGTPEGFNWDYEYFIENPREDTDLIFGDMRLNTHTDEGYAQMLQDSYDDIMAEQFVEGKYVNLQGKAAIYAFSRARHGDSSIVKDPNCPQMVSLDFNINPMSATLWNRRPGIAGKTWLEAWKSIKIMNSNTYEMSEALKQYFNADDVVTVYPDPAGTASSTKIDRKRMPVSDIQILREHGFTDIRYKRKLIVKDCVNSLNNLFAKNRIKVNTKECRDLVADLEQCIMKPGTSELDKRNPLRTHWLDGAKNMADYEFPVVKSDVRLRIQQMR